MTTPSAPRASARTEPKPPVRELFGFRSKRLSPIARENAVNLTRAAAKDPALLPHCRDLLAHLLDVVDEYDREVNDLTRLLQACVVDVDGRAYYRTDTGLVAFPARYRQRLRDAQTRRRPDDYYKSQRLMFKHQDDYRLDIPRRRLP